MKRPLMTSCSIYLVTLAAAILMPSSYLNAAVVIFSAAAVLFFILSLFRKKYKNVVLLLVVSILTMISFQIYNHVTLKPASELAGKNADITATILETEISDNGNKFYIAKLNSINGDAARAIKIRLYAANSENLSDYDDISVSVNFFSNDSVSASERYYLSNNILASAITTGEISVTNQNKFSLLREICSVRDKMVFNIRASVADERGNIICAILFGKRDYIDPSTAELFALSGISHLLAVSGLHLSIIVMLLNNFLLLFGIGKTPRSIIALLLTYTMMIMTGFTPSVIRAAIMTTLSLIAQCARRDYDSPTALALSAVIICIANPYAITNIGFLLSFSATFGLIVSQIIIEKKRLKFSLKTVSVFRLFIHETFKLLLPCFFAFLFTIPVSSCVFGYISSYSPIINLILSPLLPAVLALSLSSALLSLTPFSFLYQPILYITKLLISCITWFAEKFSTFPFAKISIQSDLTLPLVIIFLLLFLIAAHSKHPRKNSIAALLVCIPVICTAVISNNTITKDYTRISIIGGSSAAIMIESEGKCFISGFSEDTSYQLNSALKRQQINNIFLLSAENIPSSEVSSLTHFALKHNTSYLVIPSEYAGAITSLHSGIKENCYISEDFLISTENISVHTKVSGKNTVVFYEINGFKIAHLNIQAASLIPENFSCDLLIANSKALPFIEKYKSKYFLFSE